MGAKPNSTEIEKEANFRGETRVPRVMLTTKQKRILDKLVGADVQSTALDLGISTAAIYNSNKRVYQNFRGLLDAMVQYEPVFRRRLEKDDKVLTQLRRLWRMTRNEKD